MSSRVLLDQRDNPKSGVDPLLRQVLMKGHLVKKIMELIVHR